MKLKNLFKSLVVGALASMLAVIPAAASYGTVTADLLTIRTAPSTESDAVGYLSYGEGVDITYEPGYGWLEIYYMDNCYYVCGDYVARDGVAPAQTQSYADPYGYEYSYIDGSVSYDYNANDYGYDQGTSQEETYSNQKYLGNFTLSAYCGCAACCGAAGQTTASGTMPKAGRTVAMGGVPFGTKLLINGHVYTVEDRGTSYGMVDIFCSSHAEAIAFGLQSADVYQID